MMNRSTSVLTRVFCCLVIFAFLFSSLPGGAVPARAAASELFFSEYIEGSSNNKALEIYNGTGAAIDLASGGYKIQMYFNGSPSAGLTINLTGTVADGDVFVLAHSSADAVIRAQADQTNGSGWFNGDDAVALLKGATIIDVIGQIGFDPGSEWGTGLTSTADNTLIRKSTIEVGDPNGSDAFDPSLEWIGFAQNTFGGLGAHNTPILTCGAISIPQGRPASSLISATDPDDTVVNLAISSVSPDSAAGSFQLQNITPALAPGGIATATLSVADNLAFGTYTVSITASTDNVPIQTGACSLTVSVLEVTPIGAVQGVVDDTMDGTLSASPYINQTVIIRGVIYEKLMSYSGTNAQYGFFIQNTTATADSDPYTSDGIYVYMSTYSTLIGGYAPQVGDEVIITGKVSEYYYMTELSSASLVELVRSGVDLTAEIPAIEANPPSDLATANRYWERLEGMRVWIPEGSIATSGRSVFASSTDSEIWVVRPDVTLTQCTDEYAWRSYRDPHPCDDNPEQVFDNGNGYRILIGPMGVKAAAADAQALLAPASTYDTLAAQVTGGVNYSYEKYRVEAEVQPVFNDGLDPSQNGTPEPYDTTLGYSLVTFNLENLYDFRDDPFDGCDFTGNPGCPGVRPPFDYVPASQAVYAAKLANLASQIVNDLGNPDIIMAQEAEDQDICTIDDHSLVCGTADNADGMPDTAQELATLIFSMGGPEYAAAYDRNGADDRGIVSVYLYRTDRVELLPALDSDPVLGSDPQVEFITAGLPYNSDVQNPKALNAELPDDIDTSTGVDGSNVFTRAPQVGLFRIWRDGIGLSVFTDLYLIDNHFSSTPDGRVAQRTLQAAYDAAIVQAIEASGASTRVAVGGDLNVYPRPDDPFADNPSDQLGALYEQGLTNLYDVLLTEDPDSAYSYVYIGQAQTLDQIFVSPALFADLGQFHSIHINSDFPADYDGDGARGTSDHDPQFAQFGLSPTLETLTSLVLYYYDNGMIEGRNTLKILIDRLEKIGDREILPLDAYNSQVQAFIDQVWEFSTEKIDPTVAEILASEAYYLMTLP